MSTILVVEDDTQVRDFLTTTLNFAGHTTVTASDGVSGIQRTEETTLDLIISDVNMPNMGGFEMLEQIRASSKHRGIPIIFLTADSNPSAMRKGMLTGAEDYLAKPVSPADLLAAVQVQLRKRAQIEEDKNTTLRLLRKNIIYALPHELRTPLHTITGYAHIMEMDEGKTEPQETLRMVRAIIGATERLGHVVENYLIYAQLELIHSDPVELEAARNHIVRDCSAIISAAANKKARAAGRAADLSLDLLPMALRISEDNLKKIILELVDNAFKFSKPGSPVHIRSKRVEDQLQILICDRGRGMTPEEIAQMGAYMQFGRELYEQQGLGLGFTVAKRLVELHGGAVKVDSLPDKGTVVTIRFSVY
jgi:signal transduction histidine kinase